ncbi:MAG: polyprenyl synthetase family protein [Lachnospiraceae bacterium]|nr:polyprenyl synthetase family protein [Lachnospiraceae bacterium]
MSFNESLKKRTEEIEQIIQAYLPKEEGFQKTVIEAMNYSVLAGGKRLRPMLLQEAYHFFGGTGEIVEPFMAAVEMIHTYSLVHDDLPAMDNDEYRRGRKTTHIQFGHAMGILAGDALLNYAFETMAKAADIAKQASDLEYYPLLERVMQAQRILAGKAGIYGMVGGQTADVEATEKKEILTREKLDFIYRLKTSALIEGSMMAGAVLAGASEQEVRKIEEIAGKVGLAFQIQDDILDVTSTTEMLGKPVFSDEKNQKTTYVTLEGLEKAGEMVESISQEAIRELQKLAESLESENKFLEELLIWLIHREK